MTSEIPIVPMWVNGRPYHSATPNCGDVFDPATGRMIRRAPFAARKDVAAAVAAAAAAFPAWSETTPVQRARLLDRFRLLLERERSALARLISQEHGKTVSDALGSLQRGIEVVEFASGAPHLLKGEHAENVGREVDCHSALQPLGVCVGITPFNFPVMVPLWMFPVALVCGNTFVLKPSEKVPSAAVRMAELLKEAGLPDGVFNVVHGDKSTVEALLAHPDVKAVSFVGSTPVARAIYAAAAANGKRVQALGGAKNHAVVLPDADLDFAADALIGAGFGSAGQRCMAISAIVAVGAAGDALAARLKDKAARIRVGPGTAEGVDMGPVITREHRDRIRSYIEAGVRAGARLILDGRVVKASGAAEGFFIGPTIFDHVTPDMTIYRDEIFGPVLTILRAASFEDAIALVNANPYANGAAVFTKSGGAARKFQNEIDAGMVGINVPIPAPTAFFSFGGWKSSMFGDLHMHGVEGIYFYTRRKVITGRWTETDPAAGSLNMPTAG